MLLWPDGEGRGGGGVTIGGENAENREKKKGGRDNDFLNSGKLV